MSLELLKTIEKAEAQAEAVRQDAQKAARELLLEWLPVLLWVPRRVH